MLTRRLGARPRATRRQQRRWSDAPSWLRPAGAAGRRSLLIALALASLPACAVVFQQANVAYVELMAEFSPAEVRIEIHKSFIARLMNRATMDVEFVVEQANRAPFPAFIDGDLHFAGRSPQVGLPVVGEIINAAEEKAVIDLVHEAQKSAKPLALSGVWRIWPEHAGNGVEVQGQGGPPTESANPDHVFEIHPVTAIAGVSLLNSFHPVEGFRPGAPALVIPSLEKVHARLTVRHGDVVIATQKGLFNDLGFIMEVADERQRVTADARFVTASLLDTDGSVLGRGRRMVFVRDTAPERAVRGLGRGARLHVYGMPRIDLSEIHRRLEESWRQPSLLDEHLPYEVVILGVFK